MKCFVNNKKTIKRFLLLIFASEANQLKLLIYRAMDINIFIRYYKEAFSENTKLPLGFWYSDQPAVTNENKLSGCVFKYLPDLYDGKTISFSLNETPAICSGALGYWGFKGFDQKSAEFVSVYEKFIRTPEMFFEHAKDLPVETSSKPYLNIARIDKIKNPKVIEGVVFFVNPDVLSGLISWIFLDDYSDNAIITRFGSGCSNLITTTAYENRMNGKRSFLGGFDPSLRPHVEPDELTLSIPMSHFRKLLFTMQDSCLSGTREWSIVRNRIQNVS